MPPLETTDRRQDAVLWAYAGHDGYGQPTVAAGDPVGLKVRWTQRRTESTDPQGNTIALDATAVLDRAVAVGSILALGTVADWQDVGTGNAAAVGELHEVVTYSETRDIKGRFVRRTVGLRRYRDTLPGRA